MEPIRCFQREFKEDKLSDQIIKLGIYCLGMMDDDVSFLWTICTKDE
jgi:hypothetical protein